MLELFRVTGLEIVPPARTSTDPSVTVNVPELLYCPPFRTVRELPLFKVMSPLITPFTSREYRVAAVWETDPVKVVFDEITSLTPELAPMFIVDDLVPDVLMHITALLLFAASVYAALSVMVTVHCAHTFPPQKIWAQQKIRQAKNRFRFNR